jgi:hypothetical protein
MVLIYDTIFNNPARATLAPLTSFSMDEKPAFDVIG